jgi:CheY-specific phosphatase CheX
MRPAVKNGIALLTPQGFLDGNNTSSFLGVDDIAAIAELKVDIVLVSLKKVVFFNKNGLDAFIKLFSSLRKKKKVTVGFCDYDQKKYLAIKKFFHNELFFSLFKSIEIAYLFSSSFKNKNYNVLLYSDDKSQRSAIAIELHDNGHNPIIAQSQEEFDIKKEKKESYDYIIESTFLGQMGEKIASRVTGNAIIYTISSFLDADLNDKFNIEYHNNSLNVGFRLFIFDAYKVVSMNIHALNFFSKLSSSAAEYCSSICIVGMKFDKTQESFRNTLEDAGILFYEQMDDILLNKDLLKELAGSSASNIKQKRFINKETILELPRFIDATVATIEMMTNAKAIKEQVEVRPLTINEKEGKIASSIGYYGAIDGMVILIFPADIAKKACELLIGEATDDMEMVLDTLAELVNIVGGKIKTLLADNGVNVSITLPRTYHSIDDLREVVKDRKGVQVDLLFNNKKFLFFLTR